MYVGQPLIIMDGFRAGYSVPYGVLEAISNGNYKVPVKGGTPVEVPPYVTIVILTNLQSFGDIYDPDHFDLAPLACRFNYLDMKEAGIAPYRP